MAPQYSIIQHHTVVTVHQYSSQYYSMLAEHNIESMEPTSQYRHIGCTTHYSKALHSAVFVACPYIGMRLSYSSKFRVAVYRVRAVVNHVIDSQNTTNTEFFRRAFSSDVNTLICTLSFTAFVEETQRKY